MSLVRLYNSTVLVNLKHVVAVSAPTKNHLLFHAVDKKEYRVLVPDTEAELKAIEAALNAQATRDTPNSLFTFYSKD